MAKVKMVITFLLITSQIFSQAPTEALFKKIFYDQMQKLLPTGFTKRTISFETVTKGKPSGSYYPFKVIAFVHDYGPGYPANKYFGQSCLGKMDGWKFDLVKDGFGEWIVQGRFTVSNTDCKDNAVENVASISLPGQAYVPGEQIISVSSQATSGIKQSELYVGEYACYGTGGRLMAGLGFILLPNGKYYDVDKKRGGNYVYSAQKATIKFDGGFLSGQQGTGVKSSGFDLSNTVRAEPWR